MMVVEDIGNGWVEVVGGMVEVSREEWEKVVEWEWGESEVVEVELGEDEDVRVYMNKESGECVLEVYGVEVCSWMRGGG